MHVREVHPEVCFYFASGGRPMRHPKKSSAGCEERMAILDPSFPGVIRPALESRDRRQCGRDDIVDAFVALWTARRIRDGVAITLPKGQVPRDRYGLAMEMVA